MNLSLLGVAEAGVRGRKLGFRTRKVLALLAYLALEPGLHSRDKLVALLWPQAEEGAGRSSLRNTLALLAGELGVARATLSVSRSAVGLEAIALDLDVRQLEAATHTHSEAELEAALQLYRGDLLEGFDLSDAPEFDDWLLAEREVVRGWVDRILQRLATLQSQAGKLGLALETATRRLRLEPLNEAAHRQVIGLHLKNTNRIAALEAYNACREVLLRELGLEPDGQTQALLERIQLLSDEPTRKLHARTLEAPLVGRAAEHIQLIEEFHLATTQARVVLIEGEAGIGKTRLVLEFLQWARAVGAPVLHGRSFETGGRLPYQPMIEALRSWLEQHPSSAETLSKVWLGELSALLPELRERFPDLPESVIDQSIGNSRLFESVVQLVLPLCQAEPLVLFIDDLQWTDTPSLELLHYVVRRLGEARVLLLLNVRSEELASMPVLREWIEGLQHDTPSLHLALSPLSESATQNWLAALGAEGQALEGFSRWLFGETQGQPLFISQTLKHLLEQGLISYSDQQLDVSRVSGELKPILAPGLLEVIRARLNRLSPAAFSLLSAGAVLGQDLEFALMYQVAGLLEDQALEALDKVLEAHLLLEARPYRFSHDKIRDTTYTLAGEARRKVFHRRALELLETAKAPTAVLAHHAFAANRWAAAFGYSVDAARFAFLLGAFQEALTHGERARELLKNPPPGFSIEGNSAPIKGLYQTLISTYYMRIVDMEMAYNLAQEMYSYAKQTVNPSLESEALVQLSEFFRMEDGSIVFDLENQTQLLNQALYIAKEHNLHEDALSIEISIMNHDYWRARFQEMLERGERILPLARELGGDYPSACLLWMAVAYGCLGQWEESERFNQESLSLLDPHDLLSIANQNVWSGLVIVNQGRVQEGTELARTGFSTFSEFSPIDGYTARLGVELCYCLIAAGELGEALAVAKQSHDLAERQTDLTWRVEPCIVLGLTLLSLGQIERGLEVVLLGLGHNHSYHPQNQLWALRYTDLLDSVACALLSRQANWQDASKYARQAAEARFQSNTECDEGSPTLWRWLEVEALLRGGEIELARKTVDRLGEFAGHYTRRQISYLRSLAVLEAWEGNLETAIGSLEEARDLMIPIGLPNERWTLEADLTKLYSKAGRFDKAEVAKRNAFEVIALLAERITDLELRQGFLTFADAQVTPPGKAEV